MKPNEAIEKTRAVIRRQHKALSTEQSYLHAEALGVRSPLEAIA